VVIVLVHDDDLRLVGIELATQAVGGQRAARAPAKDHDSPRHSASMWVGVTGG